MEIEFDLNVYSHRYRLAFFGRRSEPILLDCLCGLCVKAIPCRLHKADVLRLPIDTYDEADHGLKVCDPAFAFLVPCLI